MPSEYRKGLERLAAQEEAERLARVAAMARVGMVQKTSFWIRKAISIVVNRLDKLDKATLYLKIIIDNTEFTRTINMQQARSLPSGTWARVVR